MLFQAFWFNRNVTVDVYHVDHQVNMFLIGDGGRFKWEPITEFAPLKKEEKEEKTDDCRKLLDVLKGLIDDDRYTTVDIFTDTRLRYSGYVDFVMNFILENNLSFMNSKVMEIKTSNELYLPRTIIYCSED